MWIIAAALAVGLVAGYYMPLAIPLIYGHYLSIAVLAALDTALGGLRAYLEDRFDVSVFATGFASNVLLAGFFTFLGDRLGVELYYAALFALGMRVFNNLGVIRRDLMQDWKRRGSKKVAVEQNESQG
ncbi:MAG: small basic family protein [Symbiobacteriia bacterium]